MRVNMAIIIEGLLCYWCRKLLPNKKINISTDNRYNAHMIVKEISDGEYKIAYNKNKIKEWNFAVIVSGVFHEIGHIKYGWITDNYNNNPESIMEEYFAEKYSVEMIKKYYPTLLRGVIKHIKMRMNTPDWVAQFPVHFQAYQHIKEYEL